MNKIPTIKLPENPTANDVLNELSEQNGLNDIFFVLDVLKTYAANNNEVYKYKWKLDLAKKYGILLEKKTTKLLMDECYELFASQHVRNLLNYIGSLAETVKKLQEDHKQLRNDIEDVEDGLGNQIATLEIDMADLQNHDYRI